MEILDEKEVLKAKERVNNYAKYLAEREISAVKVFPIALTASSITTVTVGGILCATGNIELAINFFTVSGVTLPLSIIAGAFYRHKQKNVMQITHGWVDTILYSVCRSNRYSEQWDAEKKCIQSMPTYKEINKYFDFWEKDDCPAKFNSRNITIKRYRKQKIKSEKQYKLLKRMENRNSYQRMI